MVDKYIPRMKSKYDAEIAAAMTAKFGYKNAMEVPKIEKITINMGVGEASQDKKKVTTAAAEMELIAGQKPVRPHQPVVLLIARAAQCGRLGALKAQRGIGCAVRQGVAPARSGRGHRDEVRAARPVRLRHP